MARTLSLVAIMMSLRCHAAATELGRSTSHFGSCIKKNDVDVVEFADATRAYCKLLARFGPFTLGSIQQVISCLAKIEDSCALLSREGKIEKKRMRSMKALLRAEVECQMHRKHGVIADPSAAMGFLWIRRGLAFWAHVFALEAQRLASTSFACAPPGTLEAQTQLAYKKEIASYHGWVSRKAFMVSMRTAPEWEILCSRTGLPSEGKDLAKELRAWSKIVGKLSQRMRMLQMSMDLEDKRRSV